MEISDKDIEHLNKTIGQVLIILQGITPSINITGISQIQGLINVDTLKAMQLLGFNFKAAIGDPLTNLCANAILSKTSKKNTTANISTDKKK
jgi:hypothetical protein